MSTEQLYFVVVGHELTHVNKLDTEARMQTKRHLQGRLGTKAEIMKVLEAIGNGVNNMYARCTPMDPTCTKCCQISGMLRVDFNNKSGFHLFLYPYHGTVAEELGGMI